jgi:hypothetical protein
MAIVNSFFDFYIIYLCAALSGQDPTLIARPDPTPPIGSSMLINPLAYRAHWESLAAKRLAGTHVPSPVRRVEIPKPNGGKQRLGIPTVQDRWIQQVIRGWGKSETGVAATCNSGFRVETKLMRVRISVGVLMPGIGV